MGKFYSTDLQWLNQTTGIEAEATNDVHMISNGKNYSIVIKVNISN
jgi:hypothetical protein